MLESSPGFGETAEFDDDASYSWWRDAHPGGFVLALRAGHPPLLHRASCPDVDRARRPGRLKGKGRRQLCSESKSALRAWLGREFPSDGRLLDRCPKCAP